MSSQAPQFYYPNGINGATGGYLLPSLSPKEVTKIARGETIDPKHLGELQWRHRQASATHFGAKEGLDPKNLAETGWGVIFSHDADPAIKEALQPLLTHRKNQATRKSTRYYKEYVAQNGCGKEESKQQFLARHGAGGAGPADPEKIPYYLLIVGDPESISFRFQYQLDVAYAVGRINFQTLEEYARYAQSVVDAESGPRTISKTASFFAPRNPGDEATHLSAANLVKPLSQSIEQSLAGWKVDTFVGKQATKAQLEALLGGAQTPSFLFTASHGVGFPNGDPRQLPHQGSLVCQDWPGPLLHRGPMPEEFYFSAGDLPMDARIHGMISFHFACYGAGTPRLDDFAHHTFSQPKAIAPHAFVARLPHQLLAHPKGGSLAVIGHVERAWGCSFVWPGSGKQLTVFEDVIKRLLSGHPVGSATEPLNNRYAELSSDLNMELEDIKFGKNFDEYSLAGMWLANNDARSYAIIGDPAVRLLV